MENKVNIFFSEFFDVLPALVEGYGAVVVSLIGDLPLFIDPFLLFNSDNPIYQQLQTTLSSISFTCEPMRRQLPLTKGY